MIWKYCHIKTIKTVGLVNGLNINTKRGKRMKTNLCLNEKNKKLYLKNQQLS